MTDVNPRPKLLDLLATKPLVLDSAMGTRLMARGLSFTDDDPALWNLNHPDAVRSLHQADLQAGSDILLTNTFGANRDWLDRFGKSSETLRVNQSAVSLARGGDLSPSFLLGSIGPGFRHLASIEEQAEILDGEGVDAILFETFRFEHAVEVLSAVRPRTRLPLMVSIHDWDQTMAEQARQLEELGVSAMGTNCIAGLDHVVSLAGRLRAVTALPILMKPSAGLPGDPADSPKRFGEAAARLFKLGVRMVGGCCGTTEEHVAEIRRACYDAQSA